jgi:hypothetical protein
VNAQVERFKEAIAPHLEGWKAIETRTVCRAQHERPPVAVAPSWGPRQRDVTCQYRTLEPQAQRRDTFTGQAFNGAHLRHRQHHPAPLVLVVEDMRVVHAWLDNWRGAGHVVVGTERHGYKLSLRSVAAERLGRELPSRRDDERGRFRSGADAVAGVQRAALATARRASDAVSLLAAAALARRVVGQRQLDVVGERVVAR